MKQFNKLEKNIYWIYIISLIIDNINGLLLMNDINLPISIGQIYRYIMLLFFGYFIIRSKDKKILKRFVICFTYMLALCILYFIEHNTISGFIIDFIYAVKLIFPFIIIYALHILDKEEKLTGKLIDMIFYTLSIIAPLSLILPKLLNIGYKGFYYSNNEINVLLICTYIFSIEKLYQERKIADALLVVLNAAALFLIGSKTSLAVIVIVAFIYIYRFRKNKKWFIGILIACVLSVLLGLVVFSSQIDEMINRFVYYYNMLIDEGGIITFLMSTRNLRIMPAFQKNIMSNNITVNILNFIFGIGRFQQFGSGKLSDIMELDFFDTFFWYGAVTAITVLINYLYFFYKTRKNSNKFMYKLMYIIIFTFSMIAGHVWYSALSSGIFALVISKLLIKDEGEK